MKEFFTVQTPAQVYKKLDCFGPLSFEKVPLEASLHRVLYEDIVATTSLPEFPRSTVDGFAVRAEDTFGASESNPVVLRVVGEIPMGQVSTMELKDGEAIKVATGGMVPKGANAVEMVEYTEVMDRETIHVFRPLSPFENVMQIAEDIKAGELLLHQGHWIRPQDIGLMAAIGKTDLRVYCQPRVAILSSGDEIVPVETSPKPGQIRDINRFTIVSMVKESGGIPIFLGIARDQFSDLKEKIELALSQADMVALTGGSSVGTLDLTGAVLQTFSGTEILAHGISIRPGKPTLLANVGGKPFLGLPGHPVSAIVIFHFFGKPLLRILGGFSKEKIWHQTTVRAKTARNVPSVAGREDYVRVKLIEKDGDFLADPVFGKSGAIRHLVEADGLIRIDMEEEGLQEGEEVDVILI